MLTREMSGINLQKHSVFVSHIGHTFYLLILLLTSLSTTDAVTLAGSSEYAIPGSDFTLTCDVPDEAIAVIFYRRPDVSTPVGSVKVVGSQCYNPPDLCTPDVCSCVTTSTEGRGTVFRWVIQPQEGDHGSVWFCTSFNLPDQIINSPDYTLSVADGPGAAVALSPPDTSYTRNEGDTLPDITCTADCRPDCTFVWTKPDNTNFTASAVLSLGQLNRSEHGTYRCTAGNVIGTSSITTSVNVQYGPGAAVALSPPDTAYTRNEGDTLPDITCTADCRPDCTFFWTKPDNTNFTASAVLSLGQLDRSEHGTYRCTAGNEFGEYDTTTKVSIQFCDDACPFYRQMFVTSIVLTCVSVIILLINLGIGVFVTRFGHLPFMKRRMNRPNTSPQPFSSIEDSGNAMAGIASGQERSMYTELDTTDFAAQNVYDQARPAHDIVLDGRAERSNYETLGEVSGPNVYEELKERRGSSSK
ncbi:basement membrane-specific heparan sulfate proteoglycan core protein-like [Mizuhopecten yessoensis]|uniref:basement membrane-specific heparan sulfate proteoglycan core protein-like n=1 Tax=Mizuhopecten yessoensis TaxID=6573 RepID=UPI000B45CC67|nr:basement membrane-specific heparan sulfate proteoglycan core protein-like [Mizuhopecten yessoensis]